MVKSFLQNAKGLFSKDLKLQSPWDFDRTMLYCVALAGVLLRLWEYLGNRDLWLDEYSLLDAIARHSLFEKIANQQAAPLLFLVVEKLIVGVFGPKAMAVRIVPMAAGVVSVLGFAWFVRRSLAPAGAWVALALFAVSDDLIYFSTEFKPYSSDVAAALGALVIGLCLIDRTPDRRTMFSAWLAGAVLIWFSYPVPLVLAGSGLAAIHAAWRRRDRLGVWRAVVVSLGWGAAFVPFYVISRLHLPKNTVLWAFWEFAFPPRSATAIEFAGWLARSFLGFFLSPLEFSIPWVDPRVAALPAILLFCLGLAVLARNDPSKLILAATPIVLAIAAACTRLYPFHGRLVLFLMPSFYYLIARGWTVLRGSSLRVVKICAYLILAALLMGSTITAVRGLFEIRERGTVDAVGDYRDVRDYDF